MRLQEFTMGCNAECNEFETQILSYIPTPSQPNLFKTAKSLNQHIHSTSLSSGFFMAKDQTYIKQLSTI